MFPFSTISETILLRIFLQHSDAAESKPGQVGVQESWAQTST